MGALATSLACSRAQREPTFTIALPTRAQALSVDDARALVATVEIPGVLAPSPLTISADAKTATGQFVLNVDKAKDAQFTIKLSWQPDATSNVLLGRLTGNLHLTPHVQNKLDGNGTFDTCGNKTDADPCTLEFDLNRNGISNLDDLVATDRVDPRPSPAFVDVAPSDLTFPSGIRLGEFARQVIVIENTSGDPIDVTATLIGAPGSSMALFSQNGTANADALRKIDFTGANAIAAFSEQLIAVSFAPVNGFLTVGDVFVEAVNQRTKVPQATRVRLLANVDGQLAPVEKSFDTTSLVDKDCNSADCAGFSGHVQAFDAASLFNGLAVTSTRNSDGRVDGLSYTGQTMTATFADGTRTVPADYAFLVEVPKDHKLAVSLSNLESDVDLAAFILEAGDKISTDAAKNIRIGKSGTSPEAFEHKNSSGDVERALVVLGRVELDPPPATTGALDATDLAPFSLSAQVTHAPEFTQPVSPQTGPLEGGTRVVLTGEGFEANATVTFSNATALDCTYDDTALPTTTYTCTSPPGSLLVGQNPATVVVADPSQDQDVNGDGQAATLPVAFTYDPPAPRLDDITPTVAPDTGSTGNITLTGAFFSQKNGNPTVLFDGVPAAGVVFVSSTTLECIAPPHPAGSASVSVQNLIDDGGLSLPSNPRNFTYVTPTTAPPTVSALSPSTGTIDGGTVVNITGTSFIADPPPTILFGGTPATAVSVDSSSSITCTAPSSALATAVDVEVIDGDGQRASLPAAYTYVVPSPAIASVFPASGAVSGGTFVVLTGDGYRAGATVDFVDTTGAATTSPNANRVSTTSMLVATPAVTAGGTYTVRVTNVDGQRAELPGGFTYLTPAGAAPRVDTIVPNTGSTLGGDQIVITGANFVHSDGNPPAILFGSVAVTDVVVDTSNPSAETLTFRSPPSSAAGPVVIRAIDADGQSDTIVFSYVRVFGDPPIIDSVTPGVAKRGDTLTILGRNFDVVDGGAGNTTLDPLASLFVGGQAINNVTATAGSLTFTVPNLDSLVVNGASVAVELRNGDGQGTSAVFVYSIPAVVGDPRIDAVTPGTAKVGDTVEIDGANFNLLSLKVGGATVQAQSAGVVSANASTIRFVVPNPGGTLPAVVSLKLTNVDGRSANATLGINATTAPAPRIDAIAPAVADINGGTAVTLTGANFTQQGGVLTIGTTPVTPTSVSATSIQFTAPAHAAGTIEVTWTNADAQAARIAMTYAVNTATAPRIDAIAPATVDVGGGTAVTLTGVGFATSGGTLKSATTSVTPTNVTATSITFTAPAHAAGSVQMNWTNPDGQSTRIALNYASTPATLGPPPRIDAISPDHSPTAGNVVVTLAGSFATSGGTLKVGGTSVTPTSVTAASVSFRTAAHAAGVVAVVWTNPDGQSASASFAFSDTSGGFVPPPATVGLVSPSVVHALVPGDVVDLVGESLATTTSVTIEDVNGVQQTGTTTIVSTTDPSIAVVVGSALTDDRAYRFRLHFAGGSTVLSPNFTVQRPTVQAVVPDTTNGHDVIFGSLLNGANLAQILVAGAGAPVQAPVLSASETTVVTPLFPPSIPGAPATLELVFNDPVNGGTLPPIVPAQVSNVGTPPLNLTFPFGNVFPSGQSPSGQTLIAAASSINDSLGNPGDGNPAGFTVLDSTGVVVASGTWAFGSPFGGPTATLTFTSSAPVTAGVFDVVLATTLSPAVARTVQQHVVFADRAVTSLSPPLVFDGATGTQGNGGAFNNDQVVAENTATGAATVQGTINLAQCPPDNPACNPQGSSTFETQFQVGVAGLADGTYRICVVPQGQPIACPSSPAILTLAPLQLNTSLTVSALSDQCQPTVNPGDGGDNRSAIVDAAGVLYSDTSGGVQRFNDTNDLEIDLRAERDALFTDLGTGALFSFTGTNDAAFGVVLGGETATGFVHLDPVTLAPTGSVVHLSSPLTLDFGSGVFSGEGFVLMFDGKDDGWRVVDLTSGTVGIATVTQAGANKVAACNGTWASFGVAESSGNQLSVIVMNGPQAALRIDLTHRTLTQVGAFSPPAQESCGLTSIPQHAAWANRVDSGQPGPGDEQVRICSAAYCGDGVCGSPLENGANCAADCGFACGNGVCELAAGENNGNCPGDCPASCGNNICDVPQENGSNCPQDCPLAGQVSSCGDGFCGVGEVAFCPQDCPPQLCGNGRCDPGETSANCPSDNCGGTGCANPNGICDEQLGENFQNCPGDCRFCSSPAQCGAGQTCSPEGDCVQSAGGCNPLDGVCEPQAGESPGTCPQDCRPCGTNADCATAGPNNTCIANECVPGGVAGAFFQPARNLSVGGQPFDVAVGDFDRNGTSDVAFVDPTQNAVHVLFFDAAGNPLGAPTTFGVGGTPEFLTTGDFNGDGILDLAVSDNSSNDVTILLGSVVQPGSFTSAPRVPVGSQPRQILSTDIRHSGRNQDLIVGCAGQLFVLLSNGNGTFTVPPPAGAAQIQGIALADFNHDGQIDVATADGSAGGASIFRGDGNGNFTTISGEGFGTASTVAIAAGDFDLNGTVDLAVLTNNNQLVVAPTDPNGILGAPRTFGTGSAPVAVAVIDANHDGLVDIAVVDNASSDVLIFANSGGLNFTIPQSPFSLASSPFGIVVTDFNRDGRNDLVIADSSGSLSALLGN